MGNTCNGNSEVRQQVTSLVFHKEQSRQLTKRMTISDRFPHEIQKLKIDGNNMYKLILPVEGQREEIKSIECKFLFSYADMQMHPQYQFTLQDLNKFPIIDPFQPQQVQNPQVYHKITSHQNKRRLMKYYNFSSFSDYEFKKALYEISLYKRLPQSKSPLKDYFVIYKGERKQVVMIFDFCYVSLNDIVYFRKMANYSWEEKELLIVIKMLCEGLMGLEKIGVVHRDIRPSNIFFQPMNVINTGLSDTDDRKKSISSVLESTHEHCYSLFNLESARVVDYQNNTLQNDDTDLLTVKGVPPFTQGSVRQALEKQQHKANYNPHSNDIIGLKKTLYAMINLDTSRVNVVDQERIKHRHSIRELQKFLETQGNLTVQKVDQKVCSLLGISSVMKTSSYYSLTKQFYIKQLTIAQNIESNLYFNNNWANATLVNDPSNIMSLQTSSIPVSSPNSINLDPTQNFQQLTTNEYIEGLYIRTLYDLQKKEVFVPYMLGKLSRNFELGRKEENVQLLIKVGRYFEDGGIRENEYYKEAILLLVQIAQDERLEGFLNDHSRLVSQAEELYGKFSPDSLTMRRVKCMLLREKAYKEVYSRSLVQNPNDLMMKLLPPSSPQSILGILHQSYELALQCNLPFQEQLSLIYAKGQICFLMNNFPEAEVNFLNGYQIAEKNSKEFMTAHNANLHKGMFEYALGLIEMQKLRLRVIDRQPRVLFDISEKFNKAMDRFSNVRIHPVFVVKCYIAMGDLGMIKEDSQSSRKCYERALNLVHAQNQSLQASQQQNISLASSRNISARIELEIVEKLINVLNMSNNTTESRKYEQLHDLLKKEFGRPHKAQNRFSRGGRTSRKQKPPKQALSTSNNVNLLPVIREEEQDQNRGGVESSRQLEMDFGYSNEINAQLQNNNFMIKRTNSGERQNIMTRRQNDNFDQDIMGSKVDVRASNSMKGGAEKNHIYDF